MFPRVCLRMGLDSSCYCGVLFFLCDDIWSCVKKRNNIHWSTQEVLNNPQMYELLARQCVPVRTGTRGASSRISPWLLSNAQGSFLQTMVKSLHHLSWACLSVESSRVWASLINFFGKRHHVLISLSSGLAEDRRKKIKMDLHTNKQTGEIWRRKSRQVIWDLLSWG